MSYLYKCGDRVFHYDAKNDTIVSLTIRHTMSGWHRDDWEYYNCVGDNYDEDGDDIWEVSQNDLYPTLEEAKQRAIRSLQRQVSESSTTTDKIRTRLELRQQSV